MGTKYTKEFKAEAIRLGERERVAAASEKLCIDAKTLYGRLYFKKGNGLYGGPITQRKPRKIHVWIHKNSGKFGVALCCGARHVRREGITPLDTPPQVSLNVT